MLTRIRRDNQDGSDFDAIKFEQDREQVFNRTENLYFETDYEIDSEKGWYGSLYRVWDGRVLIGTFYQSNKKWLADPYYKNRHYQRLDSPQQRIFNSNEKAINHIIRCYEGK